MKTDQELIANAQILVDDFRNNHSKGDENLPNSRKFLTQLETLTRDICELGRQKRAEVLVPINKFGLTEVVFEATCKAASRNSELEELICTGPLVDWTDCCPEVCQTLIARKDAIPFFIERLKVVKFPTSVKDAQTFNENGVIKMLFPSYYAFLIHNLAKHPESRLQFQEFNLVDLMKRFFEYPDEGVKMSALCVTASLLSDTPQSASLADDYNIIPALVKNLELALKNEKEHFHIFYAEEFVEPLAQLAINDGNKKAIAETGVIKLLVSMLAGKDEVEQRRATDCLWALAFDDSIRAEIFKTEGFTEAITKVWKEAKSPELKTKARMASDFIAIGRQGMAETGRPKSVKPKSKDADEEGHIFISYNWEHQEIVLKIRQFLLDKGFKVWMDVDNMTNNTLEAMASGVEQAKLILICYSEHYKQSNMCRTEAEYVFRLGKPFIPINMEYRYFPTGWLGIIIGARLYVDFSLHKHPLNIVFERLSNEMKTVLNQRHDLDDSVSNLLKTSHQAEPNSTSSAISANKRKEIADGPGYYLCPCCNTEMLLIPFGNVSHPLNSQRELGKHVEGWSKADVNKWVTSIGFSASTLANFDGKALIAIFRIKEAVSFFYLEVKTNT